jgi:hypothetical protein
MGREAVVAAGAAVGKAGDARVTPRASIGVTSGSVGTSRDAVVET